MPTLAATRSQHDSGQMSLDCWRALGTTPGPSSVIPALWRRNSRSLRNYKENCMRYGLGAAIAVAFVASASSAMADNAIGLLECRGASQQFIVGSITNLQCLFRPSSGGRPQPYDASIRRVGVDFGFNQSTSLAWSVFAPNNASPGISQRHLCRPVRQRHVWRRSRSQRPLGRLQPNRCAAAGQRPEPDRVRRGRRHFSNGNARA